MRWLLLALILPSVSFAEVLGRLPETKKGALPPAPGAAKAKELCHDYQECMRDKPGAGFKCLNELLFKHQLTSKNLEAKNSKEMERLLRREGFISPVTYANLDLPEGSILLIDVHDPIKEKRLPCPKSQGKVLLKCDQFWVDEFKNPMDFNAKKKCRSKGVMIHPDFANRSY